MDLETIILEIIKKTGKSRNEIINLIEKKQLDANGAISDNAAARLISNDLQITITGLDPVANDAKIRDILHMAPGSSNIIITGIIERVYFPHKFEREQTTRYVQNLLLRDETGTIQLVLWGNMVGLVHKLRLRKGNTIRLLKGVLKNGRLGEREVHLGDQAAIQTIADDSIPVELQNIDIFSSVLLPGALTIEYVKENEIDVQGIVIKKQPHTPEKPFVFHLTDPSPTEKSPYIRIVVWNERIEDFIGIEEGTEILIESVKVKEGYQGKLDINVNRRSNLTIVSQKPINLPESFKTNKDYSNSIKSDNTQKSTTSNMASISTNPYSSLDLRILWKGKLSSFSKKDETTGHVTRLGVYDNSGSGNLVLWDDKATLASSFSVGSLIHAKEVVIKDNRGSRELHLGRNGSISLIEANKESTILKQLPAIPINKALDSWKIVTLWGKGSNFSETKTFQRKDGTEGQLRSLILIDNTGEIRIVAWDKDTELLDNINEGQLIRLENLNLKKNNQDGFDASFSLNSKIISSFSESEIPEWAKDIQSKIADNQVKEGSYYNRILLNELTEERKEGLKNDQNDLPVEFRAIIVDIDDRWVYYDGCPQCGKKVERTTEKDGVCPNHAQVTPVPKLLLRTNFDDGTKLLSGSLIGSMAEKVTGMKTHDVQQFLEQNEFDDQKLLEYIKKRLIGHEYLVRGHLGVKEVSGESDRTYWNLKINSVSKPNPKIELEILENNRSRTI